MVGVPAILWVVMGHGMGERFVPVAAAVGSLMNMEAKNPFLAGLAGLRKTANFGIDNYPFVCLVKTRPAGYARKALAAGNAGLGLRPAAQRGEKADIGQIHIQRSFTEMLYTASYADGGSGVRKICLNLGNAIEFRILQKIIVKSIDPLDKKYATSWISASA